MALYKIRLELARCPGYPEGSRGCGYEFVAPLNETYHLDAEDWRARRASCTVRRFWLDEEDEHGHLLHQGKGWRFHYEAEDPDEDEPLYKLDRHLLREGEYVSITEDDGKLYPFRVVRVTPVT